MRRIHRVSTFIGTLAATLLLTPRAEAGPPLICHPFATNGGPLLPWDEHATHWYSLDQDYDVANLTADTLRLLSADAPLIVRMENLRRATLYAVRGTSDDRAAAELLSAVFARAGIPAADQRAEALAWFDAGYLIESFRQTTHLQDMGMRDTFRATAAAVHSAEISKLDGYAVVEKAKSLAPELAAEIEFAQSLMARDAASAELHRGRAAAAAAPGSLLALNLARY